MKKLPEAGEEAGAVGSDLAVLLAQTELHREPVDCGELLDFLVRGSEAGEADLLTELGEPRVSKQRGVTDELMENVPETRKLREDILTESCIEINLQMKSRIIRAKY